MNFQTLSSNQPLVARAREIFGSRWETLGPALEQKKIQYALLAESKSSPKGFSKDNRFGKILTGPSTQATPANEFYLLDPASLVVALALNPSEGASVLDLCAAPGGKSFAILLLTGGKTQLVSNDVSRTRRERLKRNVDSFLPKHLTKNLQLSGRDASKWGMLEPNSFDFILADVPCSGERHLFESSQEMSRWTPARSKNLRVRQTAIICSAFDTLKPGGRMVYSTCSLEPKENDGIVEKLVGKREGVQVADFEMAPEFEGIEKTELGYQFLPDRCQGWGPIYFSIIGKA